MHSFSNENLNSGMSSKPAVASGSSGIAGFDKSASGKISSSQSSGSSISSSSNSAQTQINMKSQTKGLSNTETEVPNDLYVLTKLNESEVIKLNSGMSSFQPIMLRSPNESMQNLTTIQLLDLSGRMSSGGTSQNGPSNQKNSDFKILVRSNEQTGK